MNRSRTLASSVAALLLCAWPAGASEPAGAAPAAPADSGRVVILGFDGADARTVRELMEKDPARYPNMRALAESGTFAPLEVVVPAESPVSWASLNSGQNPAKTGVPGFIRRDLARGGMPNFGHIEKKSQPLEDFENTPIPVWTPAKTAAIAGGATFLAVLLLSLVLFRKLVVAGVLGLLAGGGAAYAGHEARGLLPATYPRTANVNQVDSFWDHAARAGVPCVVLDAQQAFDGPVTPGAKVLYGLGLPDARGDLGQWFIYTTDPAVFEREGKGTTTAGTVFRVDEDAGTIRGRVFGPRNFYLEQELTAEKDALVKRMSDPTTPLEESSELTARKGEIESQLAQVKKENTFVELAVRLDGDRAHVKIGAEEQSLAVGDWSDFYSVEFELNWL
jgi:hypothetical protein